VLAVAHGVDRPVAAIEDQHFVIAEEVVHPGAEVGVDPGGVRPQPYVGDGVVPDGGAFLFVGSLFELGGDGVAGERGFLCEAALIDAGGRPHDERDRCGRRRDEAKGNRDQIGDGKSGALG